MQDQEMQEMQEMQRPAPPPSPKSKPIIVHGDKDEENTGIDALRTVLEYKEVEEMQKLRRENEILKKTLRLWIGPNKMPLPGRYYFIEEFVIYQQEKDVYWGNDPIDSTPLKFDSTRSFTRMFNGKPDNAWHFVFLAPYFNDTGEPVEIILELHDLCRIVEVNFEAFRRTTLRFLDMNNQVNVYFEGTVYLVTPR